MMHDKAMHRFGAVISRAVISSLVCGAVVACAGGDTPAVNDDLEDAISRSFGNGQVAVAGGAGGRAPTASAGRAGVAAAGSANAPAAGSGGSGGQAPVAAAGAAGDPPGTEAPAEPPPSSGACNGFAVLAEHCSGGSCHGAGGLGDFAESEDAALAFVGVSGTVTCGAEGPLLNPENPRQSIIVQKVNGTVPCGAPMPIGAGPLSDDEISCLEEWIATL